MHLEKNIDLKNGFLRKKNLDIYRSQTDCASSDATTS